MIITMPFIDIDRINKDQVDYFKYDMLEKLKACYIGTDPNKIMNIKNIDKLEFNFRDKMIIITH